MRVGVFGGSFDPPHLAHVIFACDAYQKVNLDKILWVVTNLPSHKAKPIANFNDRLKMTLLAASEYKWMEVCDIEKNLPQPNYSYNLIKALFLKYSGIQEWFMMIGQDQAETLDSWYKIKQIEKMVKFLVMNRNNNQLDPSPEYIQLQRRMDISSSEIRSRIKQGQEYKCFLLPSVADYIKNRELYH